ncbi:MAG: hypothetical protein JO108_10770 [Acidobacteriaceae bacterium]|nr:hypothetical protein [Acidobacteriaceae bacterium]
MSPHSKDEDEQNGSGLEKRARILNEIDPAAPVAPHQTVPPETIEEKSSEPEGPIQWRLCPNEGAI